MELKLEVREGTVLVASLNNALSKEEGKDFIKRNVGPGRVLEIIVNRCFCICGRDLSNELSGARMVRLHHSILDGNYEGFESF